MAEVTVSSCREGQAFKVVLLQDLLELDCRADNQ